MFKISSIIFLMLIVKASVCQTSIYSFQLDSLTGTNKINLSAFAGKKILIVNTASLDSNASQYSELISLQNQYRDSLVVIVIPSNSFGSEPDSGVALSSFYAQPQNVHFPVTARMIVSGPGIHPLYAWLTQESLNGSLNTTVDYPFRKYLINEQGKLVAIITSKIRPGSIPMAHTLKNASRL